MKNILLLSLLSIFFITACKRDMRVDPDKLPTSILMDTTQIEFNEMLYDFGQIQEGETVTHGFTFKNIGDKPLIIAGANSTCGCTVPKIPEESVAPGSISSITVEFDSEGRSGNVTKAVDVYANTNPHKTRLIFKAEVLTTEIEE